MCKTKSKNLFQFLKSDHLHRELGPFSWSSSGPSPTGPFLSCTVHLTVLLFEFSCFGGKNLIIKMKFEKNEIQIAFGGKFFRTGASNRI